MLTIGWNLHKNLSKTIILIIIIDMLILIKKLDLILIVIIVKNDIKMIYIFDEYKCVHSYYSYYLLFIF